MKQDIVSKTLHSEYNAESKKKTIWSDRLTLGEDFDAAPPCDDLALLQLSVSEAEGARCSLAISSNIREKPETQTSRRRMHTLK
jgi:hypothetical protein